MNNKLNVDIKKMIHPDAQRNDCLLKNVEFVVSSGEIISFLGPSGAGKTTLLRIIAGIEKRFIGKVCLNNESITRPSRRIQIVFQDNRLFPWMSVYRNMKFALEKNGNANKGKIEDWLNKINLQDKRDSFVKHLSGGEEARISFARTFMDTPEVLLLDEPFRNLDIKTKHQIMEELLKFHNENPSTIIVLISHSIDDAIFLSDRIILLTENPMTISKLINNESCKLMLDDDISTYKQAKEITKLLTE